MDAKQLDQLCVAKKLTERQLRSLIRKAQNGDREAHQKAIEHNLRLVVSLTRHYRHLWAMGDLIQEGAIALHKAILHFDLDSGYHFSTYATVAIKNKMGAAISREKQVITIPATMSVLRGKVKRGIPLTKAQEALLAKEDAVKSAHGEMPDIPCDGDPAILAEIRENVSKLPELIRCLPYRLQEVIRMRYGLGGYEEMTLNKIGRRFGISRERVRQLEFRALELMKEYAEKRERVLEMMRKAQ